MLSCYRHTREREYTRAHANVNTHARAHTHTNTHTQTLTHKQTRIYVHKYRAAWEISKKPEIQCTCNHKGINVVTNSTFLKLNVCCSLNLNRKCFMHLCLCLKGCLCVHVFAYLFVDVFVCVCVWGKMLTCTVDHQHIIVPPFFSERG